MYEAVADFAQLAAYTALDSVVRVDRDQLDEALDHVPAAMLEELAHAADELHGCQTFGVESCQIRRTQQLKDLLARTAGPVNGVALARSSSGSITERLL